ncbi:hypothetical protein [Paraeggerthella sp. Marseille-Q4926]|uniref:hypothetical protein n=1 Tax=Paraeggerthella sp. Marseille-Q4926 TaxID=2866587 RepID=UPI001CE45015|nr:hypothetical protein [Paraeggerthella sp. Marseille-Q4926]
MYKTAPAIETKLKVLDELADVSMTLNGLASLSLSLANSGMHEPDAIRLVSCLLGYCALTTKVISDRIGEVSSNNNWPIRMP